MPRHEDIEQFKRVLASYGAGPAERAGTLTAGSARPAAADVEAEPFEAPGDLGDLGDLGDTGDTGDTDATGAPATPEPPEEGAPPDIGDLLSSLGGELGGGSSAEPTQGDENLDLSALFGEEESPALAHPQKPEAAAGLGRQKKPKPPRLPKQPKERRPRRAEPEPSPEESEALEELAAPAEEAAPLEEFPPTGGGDRAARGAGARRGASRPR